MKSVSFIFLFLINFFTFAQLSDIQIKTIDSLKQVINTSNHDSIKINSYIEWDDLIWYYQPELDIIIINKIDSISDYNLNLELSKIEKFFFLKSKGFALNGLGNIEFDKGNFSQALKFQIKSLEIKQKIKYKKGIAASLNNIGNIYNYQGDHSLAIDYYLRSLKIFEELDQQANIAIILNNIGIIYKDQEIFDKALSNFNKSLSIRKSLDHKYDIAGSLTNIGIVFLYQEIYDSAVFYNLKALQLYKDIGDDNGISSVLNNLGICYKGVKDYEIAIKYYNESLELEKKAGDQYGIAISLNNIANIYLDQKAYNKSAEYVKKALKIAKKINSAVTIREASYTLYRVYKDLDNPSKALKMYEDYISARDSLQSEENKNELISREIKYQFNKQLTADSVKNVEAQKVQEALLLAEKEENKRQKLEIKQQKQQSYFLFIGLSLAILFGGFIYNRYSFIKKQKIIIERQKVKIEDSHENLKDAHQEIKDSIDYAKRIQNAILPPTRLVKEYFKESFILYKPKDIVAGDFYWMEDLNDTILFAAADCTGHGVPGAMVSVVCHNALNRSVREFGLTIPGEILDKVRELVVEEFEKSDEDVKDGMDIALCSLKGNQLEYAGAHNPLWIIRNNEIIETKANKEPIGKFHQPTPFNTHTLKLEKGDSIYIFSDGFVDQFGGERGKKFKPANLRKLLLSIQELSLSKQRLSIDEAFENWRGELEQVDDVCMIGVRIS